MEDENDIIIEDDIMKAINVNAGVTGTTDVLVYSADLFGNTYLDKINFKIKTGAKETRDVCWQENFV